MSCTGQALVLTAISVLFPFIFLCSIVNFVVIVSYVVVSVGNKIPYLTINMIHTDCQTLVKYQKDGTGDAADAVDVEGHEPGALLTEY